MSLKKAQAIGEACLNEMYTNATPSSSWSQIKKKYSSTKTEFWLLHYLPEDRYLAIKAKYKKLLSPSYQRSLAWLLLDYSPTSVKAKATE